MSVNSSLLMQICTPSNALGWEHGWLVSFAGDIEIDHLRKRLEETEAAMERIVAQMGSVPHKLHSSSGTQFVGAKVRGLSSLTVAWRSVPSHLWFGSEDQNQQLYTSAVKIFVIYLARVCSPSYEFLASLKWLACQQANSLQDKLDE
jgi:hypothetical protein